MKLRIGKPGRGLRMITLRPLARPRGTPPSSASCSGVGGLRPEARLTAVP